MALFCSFSWLCNLPSYLLCDLFFIPSSVSGPWVVSVICLLWIVLLWTLGACICLNYSFVWIYAQNWTAGSFGNPVFSFLRNLHTLSIAAAPTYTSMNSAGGSLISTASLALVLCHLLNHGCPDWCEVWCFRVDLICISLITSSVEHLSCVLWPFVFLLCRNIYLGLLPIFQLNFLFLCYWVVRAVCVFWWLRPYQSRCLRIPSPFCRLLGCLWFPLLCQSLSVWFGPIYFLFYFYCLGRLT